MVPSFRNARAALAASIEDLKAEEKRLSSYDSPNKAQYFVDDITEASFTGNPVSESPNKRLRWTTIPKLIQFQPRDHVAPSPAPAVTERKVIQGWSQVIQGFRPSIQ
jgi:hypothetical protein